MQTTGGRVRGEAAAFGTQAFRGIPFAAAPVGALRFRPPARPEPWAGTRDATRFGDVVPQVRTPGPLGELFDPRNPQGPDCLNLNVWTPDPGAAGLPVLVWIHGGAFVIGSGSDSLYDGATFARDGVVAVTVNYRLGAAGFHHVGDDVAGSGCFGILDQIAALEWVQENIAAFGGDPARVTVAGESAGAMGVGALLAAPAARGLFRRAVLQSGAGHHCLTAGAAAAVAAEVEAALGVDPSEATDEQLVAAQAAVAVAIRETRDVARFGAEVATSGLGWMPMWGGDVLPQRPIDAVAAGASSDVEVLLGTCRHEFLLFAVGAPQLANLDPAFVEPMFATTFGAAGGEAHDRYVANRPGAAPVDLLSALETDRMFRIPAVRLAEALVANGVAPHAYRFSWESKAFDGQIRAGHAVELPFTWDHLDDPVGIGLTGAGAPQALADEMHAAWVRFVTTGDPGWAPYDLDRRATRDFGGDGAEVVEDPDGDERLLWDGVM